MINPEDALPCQASSLPVPAIPSRGGKEGQKHNVDRPNTRDTQPWRGSQPANMVHTAHCTAQGALRMPDDAVPAIQRTTNLHVLSSGCRRARPTRAARPLFGSGLVISDGWRDGHSPPCAVRLRDGSGGSGDEQLSLLAAVTLRVSLAYSPPSVRLGCVHLHLPKQLVCRIGLASMTSPPESSIIFGQDRQLTYACPLRLRDSAWPCG